MQALFVTPVVVTAYATAIDRDPKPLPTVTATVELDVQVFISAYKNSKLQSPKSKFLG